jgi:uncharacterized protein DUF3606
MGGMIGALQIGHSYYPAGLRRHFALQHSLWSPLSKGPEPAFTGSSAGVRDIVPFSARPLLGCDTLSSMHSARLPAYETGFFPDKDAMATAFKPLGVEDPLTVNIYDHDNVTYWCQKFGCTKPELRDAVEEVGTSAVALKHYIGNRQTLGARKLPRTLVERLRRHDAMGGRSKF